jgi:hypothetical protein
MIRKLSFLATTALITTTALIGSLGAAAAQTPPPPPSASTKNSTATLGWHYFHISYCLSVGTTGAYYMNIYPVEGGTLTTTDPTFQQMLFPACQTGNWVGVYTDTNGKFWDVQVSPGK